MLNNIGIYIFNVKIILLFNINIIIIIIINSYNFYKYFFN